MDDFDGSGNAGDRSGPAAGRPIRGEDQGRANALARALERIRKRGPEGSGHSGGESRRAAIEVGINDLARFGEQG